MYSLKFLVSYRHPSNFYKTSHYPKNADRTLAMRVFNNEEDAEKFVANAAAAGATDITIDTHY